MSSGKRHVDQMFQKRKNPWHTQHCLSQFNPIVDVPSNSMTAMLKMAYLFIPISIYSFEIENVIFKLYTTLSMWDLDVFDTAHVIKRHNV